VVAVLVTVTEVSVAVTVDMVVVSVTLVAVWVVVVVVIQQGLAHATSHPLTMLTAEQVSPASAKDLQLAAPAHSEVQ